MITARMFLAFCLAGLGPPAPTAAAEVPGALLDLTHWKLTLPVGRAGSDVASEVRQPELATFADRHAFFVDPAGRGVVFRAPCGGVTTRGSKYPRSELREIYGHTRKESEAVWSTDDGISHVLNVSLAITHLPDRKKEVSCVQIHDAKDDLLMVRLEGRKLLVERGRERDVVLDANYAPGDFFDLKVAAESGRIKVWYNGEKKLDWEKPGTGCYFKAGCYTQSNLSRGDRADAYGEVIIRRLDLTHMRSQRP
ncbi:MAG: polysaccharide lyase family 7 protein [Isosphaeraceae bacterium]